MSEVKATAAVVRNFMANQISGWIKESDIVNVLDNSVTLAGLFECISKLQNPSELDDIVKFLENAVRYERIACRVIDPQYNSFLLQALSSPSDRLRLVVLEALAHSPKDTKLNSDILIKLLCDEDTGISQRSIRLIVERESSNPHMLSALIDFHKSANLGEVEKFRFIETFINLGRLSPERFNIIKPSGAFDIAIQSFLSNESDLLVKLGSLTLIEALASYDSGREYLGTCGVLLHLEKELSGPLADSTTVISLMYTMSNIMRFVAKSQPEQIRYILLSPSSKFQIVLNEFIVSVVNAERMCAFKVLGALAAGTSASEPIETFLRKNWKLFLQLQYAVLDIDVEVVNTAIDSLHDVVKGWERNPFMDSDSAQMTLTETILETFKRHPFPECRCLVYSLLGVMLQDMSASVFARLMTDPSPIRAALLDYKSESNYESRRAKCDFVRVLVKMEEKNLLQRFFSKEQVENFIDFAEQGLEWVPITESKSEMETEAV